MAAKRGMQIGRFTGKRTLTFQSPYLSRTKVRGQGFLADSAFLADSDLFSRETLILLETIATLPGGWDLAHAIRLGIKPFAELGLTRRH